MILANGDQRRRCAFGSDLLRGRLCPLVNDDDFGITSGHAGIAVFRGTSIAKP
jgi:hypothetical protein